MKYIVHKACTAFKHFCKPWLEGGVKKTGDGSKTHFVLGASNPTGPPVTCEVAYQCVFFFCRFDAGMRATTTHGNDDGRTAATCSWWAMSRHGRAKQYGPEPPEGVYTKPPPPVHGNNTYNGRAHHHYQQQQHSQQQHQQQFYGTQQQPSNVAGVRPPSSNYHHHSLPRYAIPVWWEDIYSLFYEPTAC